MKHGVYKEDGPESRLRTHGTLLRTDPENEDNWLCQFDPFYVYVNGEHVRLTEAHGWHSFPKKDFEQVRGNE